ncbi:MAG: hypothetical protein J1E02_07330 [Coprobacter sp.]|nr:hypothetical protein [Coprobacter sp.]
MNANVKEYLFCIDVHDILLRASTLTAVLGASRTDGQGMLLYDFLRLTDDDGLVVQQLLRESLPELHSRLLAYRPRSAYHPDTPLPADADTRPVAHIDIVLQLPRPAFDVAADLNESLLDYWAYTVVGGWLLLKKPDEAALFTARAAACLDRITVLLNKRRRPILRRPRWF